MDTIIGTGGYGCVFSVGFKNGIEYVGKMNFNNDPIWTEQIGKIPNLNVNTFLQMQKAIFAGDPEEKYYITTREVLQMSGQDINIQNCNSLKIQKNDRRNIKLLDTYDVYIQRRVDPSPPISKWTVSQIQHALDGILLLHSLGFAHNDIGQHNYGFLHGNPVLIDMDSALPKRNPYLRIATRKNIPIVDFEYTEVRDMNSFDDMIRRR